MYRDIEDKSDEEILNDIFHLKLRARLLEEELEDRAKERVLQKYYYGKKDKRKR